MSEFTAKLKKNVYKVETLPTVTARGNLIKDWSQFVFGSWRNNLNQVVHNVPCNSGLHKGVYNLIEVISNEPNK
jgi:hypothetical protein